MPMRPIAATAAIAALLLAGCSADPSAPGAAVENAPQDAPVATDPGGAEDDAPDAEPGAARGTVVVDGVSYDMTTMRNCEPLEMAGLDRTLELQGLGEHDGARVQVDVYIQTLGGVPLDEVSWSGPEGVYGGPDDAVVTLDEAAGRVVGTATLKDSMTQTETIGIEFDLEVPTETIGCR